MGNDVEFVMCSLHFIVYWSYMALNCLLGKQLSKILFICTFRIGVQIYLPHILAMCSYLEFIFYLEFIETMQILLLLISKIFVSDRIM